MAAEEDEQAGRNENEPHLMSLEKLRTPREKLGGLLNH
jgi:hypothetical protein